MRDMVAQLNSGTDRLTYRYNIISYAMRLGELHALIANLFGFSRGETVFEAKKLTWDDMQSAYRLLDLEIDDMFITEQMNLEEFTKRWLERTNNRNVKSAK